MSSFPSSVSDESDDLRSLEDGEETDILGSFDCVHPVLLKSSIALRTSYPRAANPPSSSSSSSDQKKSQKAKILRPAVWGSGVCVATHHLSYYVRDKDGAACCLGRRTPKYILRDINLYVREGEVMGIVGPSGGGKTTLLNLLSHRANTKGRSGKILFNGHEQSAQEFRSFANYVMAHDKLHPYLTVHETLSIASKLKLPQFSKTERQHRVEQVITDMGLHRCRNTYIGGEWHKGVSSGEMKRVSIAIELLDNPQLLLLDEPTSGLDSNLALEVMQVLTGLARSGRTIIMTIHQPRSQVFSMIDRVVLLSQGNVVYQGRPIDVRSYFADLGYSCPQGWNPADFLLDLVSGASHDGGELLTSFTNPDGKVGGVELQRRKAAGGKVKDGEASHLAASEEPRSVAGSTSKKMAEVTTLNYRIGTAEVADLVVQYQKSEQGEATMSAIQTVVQHPGPKLAVVDKKTSHFYRHCQKDSWSNWFNQTTSLWKRTSLNSLRNPVVCCVMILIQAMQGLLLGGIFFQQGRDADGFQPMTINTDWLNSTWMKVYSYGVDGEGSRPLLDIVESGVDGYGSRPIYEILTNTTYLDFIHDTLLCAHTAYGLNNSFPGKPTYPPNEFFSPPPDPPSIPDRMLVGLTNLRANIVRLIDETRSLDYNTTTRGERMLLAENDEDSSPLEDPYRVMTDLVTALQLLDYFIYRADYAQAAQCLDYIDKGSLSFYMCVMLNADYLLNPLLECLDFPPLPGYDPWTVPSTGRRRLAAIVPSMTTGTDLWSMLSPEMLDFLNATMEIMDRVSSCDNPICDSIANSLDSASGVLNEAMGTLVVVLNVAGCLFFAVANLGFASYDALLTFPQERAIFNHETANGLYRVSSYFIAKNTADLPFQLIPALTLSTVYYWMVGLAPDVVQFFTYFGIAAVSTFTAYGFGYMVSAGSPRMEIAVLIAPLTLVIWLVLAGFFLRDPDIPAWISWFKYFSFYRWGFFGMVANQFPPGGFYGALPNEIILAICGITDSRIWFGALMLFVLGIGYRIVCFFLLKFTNRKVGIER